MQRRFKRTSLLLLALVSLISTATAAQPLFDIRYEATRHSRPVLALSLNVSQVGDDVLMQGTFSPRGIFGRLLIGSGKVKTLSHRNDDEFLPSTYRVDFNRVSGRATSQTFKKEQGIVIAKHKRRTKQLAISTSTHSVASMHLQLSIDAQQGRETMTYDVVSKNKLRHYVLFRRGNETIDTPLGKLNTIFFERQRNGNLDFRYWLSPAHNYLPVKGERIRDGKVDYAIVATDVTVKNALGMISENAEGISDN